MILGLTHSRQPPILTSLFDAGGVPKRTHRTQMTSGCQAIPKRGRTSQLAPDYLKSPHYKA